MAVQNKVIVLYLNQFQSIFFALKRGRKKIGLHCLVLIFVCGGKLHIKSLVCDKRLSLFARSISDKKMFCTINTRLLLSHLGLLNTKALQVRNF